MGQKDICLKRYLRDEERFADLINGLLGEGEQLITADDLTDMDSQVGYHASDRTGYRDLLKKAAFGMNFLVIGIENQEHVNYLMPLRCLSYDAEEYERQTAVEKAKIRRWKKMRRREKAQVKVQEASMQVTPTQATPMQEKLTQAEFLSDFRRDTRLHPCITIVLYFGDHWDAATHLHELLDFSNIPDKLRRYVNDYNMYLVNVRDLQNTETFQTDLKLVFDCIRFADDKERFCRHVLDNPEYRQLDEDAYDVIARYTNVLDNNEIAVENKLDGGKVNMCKAMQELMADARTEGEAKGRAAGRAEERTDIILGFLKELGTISETLVQRIMSEQDLEVLRSWAKLAARAGSIQEFELGM